MFFIKLLFKYQGKRLTFLHLVFTSTFLFRSIFNNKSGAKATRTSVGLNNIGYLLWSHVVKQIIRAIWQAADLGFVVAHTVTSLYNND